MVIFRQTICLLFVLGLVFWVASDTVRAQNDGEERKPGDRVEIVLKAGRTVAGNLIRETASLVYLRSGSGKVTIYKINIKTINGRPPFEKATIQTPTAVEDVTPGEVLIPGGEYKMGDSRGKDRPIHTVRVDSFYIDKYEVTNAEYRVYLDQTGKPAPKYLENVKYNGDDQPVVGVIWDEVTDYCRWAGKRLPTEAEWELAARGRDGTLFPWGDVESIVATNTRESKEGRPLPVGSFAYGASSHGVHDMSGNVWEWCYDWYAKDYYKDSAYANPRGPKTGKEKVIRGGGWNISIKDMAFRKSAKPDDRYASLGFRCARSN
jgi:iron(II)-dependent oxidoreductase